MGLGTAHIVGAGLAGQACALMLAEAGYQPVLWGTPDAAPARAIALSQPSVDCLTGLAVAVPDGGRIERIHVSRHGAFGHTQLSAAALGHAQFGRVVRNDDLAAALATAIAVAGIDCQPQSVERLDIGAGVVAAGQHHAGPVVLTAPVPALLAQAGIGQQKRVLNDRLWVGVMRGRLDGHAYERFTDSGPLAVLPLGPERVSVVWQCAGAVTPARINAAMGRRVVLGAIEHQACVPAMAAWADSLARPGLAVAGNASQLLHPVAGQGFNLILRQLSVLAALGFDNLEQWQQHSDSARQPWLATTLTLAQLFQPSWPAQGLALASVAALPGVAGRFAERFMEGS